MQTELTVHCTFEESNVSLQALIDTSFAIFLKRELEKFAFPFRPAVK